MSMSTPPSDTFERLHWQDRGETEAVARFLQTIEMFHAGDSVVYTVVKHSTHDIHTTEAVLAHK